MVNLRTAGEPEQPLSPTAESEKVQSLGMDYLHYGVGGTPLSEQGVTAVCDFVDRYTQEGQKILSIAGKGQGPGTGADPAGQGQPVEARGGLRQGQGHGAGGRWRTPHLVEFYLAAKGVIDVVHGGEPAGPQPVVRG